MRLSYTHVDVFSDRPFGGNPLPVFHDTIGLDTKAMLLLTQEMRQFEAIFLGAPGAAETRARIFDLFGELPFAGHPLLGAAAVLHGRAAMRGRVVWTFVLAGRKVPVTVETDLGRFRCTMSQGLYHGSTPAADKAAWADHFSLLLEGMHPDRPIEVGSTGLRYLVVPVTSIALASAQIARDLTSHLTALRAEFAVLFDPDEHEIRHWNNDGIIEDVATGSAAGVIAGYCLRHGLLQAGETSLLHQGRFAGRPSRLYIGSVQEPDGSLSITVGGDVVVVGQGEIEVLQ